MSNPPSDQYLISELKPTPSIKPKEKVQTLTLTTGVDAWNAPPDQPRQERWWHVKLPFSLSAIAQIDVVPDQPARNLQWYPLLTPPGNNDLLFKATWDGDVDLMPSTFTVTITKN